MHTLESTQVRMRDALLSNDHAPLDDILGPTAPRFEIHRRHFIRSLTAALEKTFPGVVNLVDARFFGYAADAFIRAHPPTSPCLFEYGEALADFLETFPACASLPYLGDVARMEWEMHSVFHALELGEEQLPATLRLFSSRWPVDAIWRVAMGRDDGPVDMNSGKAWVIIYRDQAEAKFESLSHASFVFHENVWTHRSISTASKLARAIDPAFDEQKAVAQLERAAAHLSIYQNERPRGWTM